MARAASAAPTRPTAETGADDRHRLPQDERQHPAAAGAERHADANLARLLADGVTRDAVNADRREQQRERAENRQQRHVRSRSFERARYAFAQRLELEDGQSGSSSATTRRTGLVSAAGVARGAHVQRRGRDVLLRQRLVDERNRLLCETVVFAVLHHACHFGGRVVTEEAEPPADRRLRRATASRPSSG